MNWSETDGYLRGINNKLSELFDPVRIASFDLDDTIIYRPIGKYSNKWKLIDKTVPIKIASFVKKKYLIIIFTNQLGIANDKKKKWMEKIEQLIQLFITYLKNIEYYFAIYVAKKYDIYRKPNIGMWELMKKDLSNIFCREKIRISKKSFFCGDAAGRIAPGFYRKKIYPKSNKGDFSDTDIKFALNIGIRFITPEDLLIDNYPKIPYKLYGVDPKKIIKMVSDNYLFKPRKKEMIIMIGPPGAGKTEFVKKYILPHNYVHINKDECKTREKCLSIVRKIAKNNRSMVIDATNPDASSRMEYTSIAHENGYQHIRAIVINTDDAISKHLNNVRHVYSKGKIPKISNIAYHVFRKKFAKPSKLELFDLIETVNFAFDTDHLKDPQWKKIFMMLSEY